jgi:hypothetical protein
MENGSVVYRKKSRKARSILLLEGYGLERTRPNEAEWNKDSSCFHYLIEWACALHQMSQYFHDARYNAWATELLSVVADKVVYCSSGVGLSIGVHVIERMDSKAHTRCERIEGLCES